MGFRPPEGQQRYDDLVTDAARVVVGLDFDGVLSPIVPDPAKAVIHPDGPRTLIALAEHDRALYLMGQYGNERWSSADGRVVSPEPPEGLDSFLSDLPDLLRTHD